MFMRLGMAFKIIDNDYYRCNKWLIDYAGWTNHDMGVLIGLERDGELTAVSGYNNFNGKSCQQHMVIKKGEYMPKRFAWFIYYYPFVQLGLDLLIGIFPEHNADIIKLATHAGFKEKYRVEDSDLLLYTMKKSDCRCLNIKIKG